MKDGKHWPIDLKDSDGNARFLMNKTEGFRSLIDFMCSVQAGRQKNQTWSEDCLYLFKDLELAAAAGNITAVAGLAFQLGCAAFSEEVKSVRNRAEGKKRVDDEEVLRFFNAQWSSPPKKLVKEVYALIAEKFDIEPRLAKESVLRAKQMEKAPVVKRQRHISRIPHAQAALDLIRDSKSRGLTRDEVTERLGVSLKDIRRAIKWLEDKDRISRNGKARDTSDGGRAEVLVAGAFMAARPVPTP